MRERKDTLFIYHRKCFLRFFVSSFLRFFVSQDSGLFFYSVLIIKYRPGARSIHDAEFAR